MSLDASHPSIAQIKKQITAMEYLRTRASVGNTPEW